MWNNKKILKKLSKNGIKMTNSNFFIVGKHAVTEALKNPKRKVLRIFLTEESKKKIHRKSPTLHQFFIIILICINNVMK